MHKKETEFVWLSIWSNVSVWLLWKQQRKPPGTLLRKLAGLAGAQLGTGVGRRRNVWAPSQHKHKPVPWICFSPHNHWAHSSLTSAAHPNLNSSFGFTWDVFSGQSTFYLLEVQYHKANSEYSLLCKQDWAANGSSTELTDQCPYPIQHVWLNADTQFTNLPLDVLKNSLVVPLSHSLELIKAKSKAIPCPEKQALDVANKEK